MYVVGKCSLCAGEVVDLNGLGDWRCRGCGAGRQLPTIEMAPLSPTAFARILEGAFAQLVELVGHAATLADPRVAAGGDRKESAGPYEVEHIGCPCQQTVPAFNTDGYDWTTSVPPGTVLG